MRSISTISLAFASLVTAIMLAAGPLAPAFADGKMDRITQSRALTHHMMGFIYDLYGLTPQAADQFEITAKFDPKSYLTRLRLGSDYARLGNFNQALNHLVLVPVLNPEDLQSHYLLALIYSTQKKIDKAAGEYEKILKSLSSADPKNTEVHFYLGQLYYSQRQYDQAIPQFEKILVIEPENTEMMYLLGSLYVEVNRRDKAIEILKRAMTIEPQNDGILNSLAYIYAEAGNHLDEALDLINRALMIDSENPAYLDSLGWVYFKKGHYAEALKALIKADALAQDPTIYDHLGDVYLALKQETEAKKCWHKSFDLDPSQKDILEKIARLEKNQP